MIRFTLAATLTLAALITGLTTTPPATAAVGTYTLMIGDSLTVHGKDNIHAHRPTWDIDGVSGRTPATLLSRIDAGINRHGGKHPANIVVAVGTNYSSSWPSTYYGKVREKLPASRITFVTPIRDPRVVGWGNAYHVDQYRYHMHMRSNRDPRACTALWAEAVQQNWGLLRDGVHATSAGEERWASEVIKGVDYCIKTEP